MKILLLSLILISLAIGEQETIINIISPPELKEEYEAHGFSFKIMFYFIIKGFNGSAAAFGFNPYGNIILGSGHLASPANACKPLTPPFYDEEWDYTPIMVIERGSCSFVTKAYYAQIVGARLVIIIDNKALEDVDTIIMSDDGHGYPHFSIF